MPSANIYFERAEWKGPLGWSAGLHAAFFTGIFLYAVFVGVGTGATWGQGDSLGSAMSATLVSRATIPLPAPPVQTQNVLANQSQGLTQSEPRAIEETPQALAIPEKQKKPKPQPKTSRETPRQPPPEDNAVPYGEGGPVSSSYSVFTAQNIAGGMSFAGGGDFGKMYAWYVDVVRRSVAQNWLKYEVDPSITAARRVYLTFDILRDGSPANVQVEQSSGVPSLDQSAVRALQRIDTFGPLPAGYGGNRVSVEFWFDYKR